MNFLSGYQVNLNGSTPSSGTRKDQKGPGGLPDLFFVLAKKRMFPAGSPIILSESSREEIHFEAAPFTGNINWTPGSR
jgi:hypothetical protein